MHPNDNTSRPAGAESSTSERLGGDALAAHRIRKFPLSTDLDLIRALWRVLHQRYPDRLFAQDCRLVEIRKEKVRSVPAERLSSMIAHAAVFYWVDSDGKDHIERIPERFAKHMVNAAEGNCPPLDGVVRAPFLAPDGSIVTCPGYHPGTRTYLLWRGTLVDYESVTPEDATEVLRKLTDFPYADRTSLAHTIGLYLLPLVRPSFDGDTPIHLVNSTGEGAGKTYLVQCVTAVALGVNAGLRGISSWGAEASRQLDAALLSADPITVIDNVGTGTTLDNPDLLRAVTSGGTLTFRPMGTSEEATVAVRTTWIMTGNHIDYDAEMGRRMVPITLRFEPDRPKLTPNLREWIIANRPHILACLLWMVRHWVEAGGAAPARSLAGFNRWSDVVGGIVESVGFEAWLAPGYRRRSIVEEQKEMLLAAWPKAGAPETFVALPAAEVLELAQGQALHHLIGSLESAAGSVRQLTTKMGIFLTNLATSGRAYGGLRLSVKVCGSNRKYLPVDLSQPIGTSDP